MMIMNLNDIELDILVRSILIRYREALGETVDRPVYFQDDDLLVPIGQQLAAHYGRASLYVDEDQLFPFMRELCQKVLSEIPASNLKRFRLQDSE